MLVKGTLSRTLRRTPFWFYHHFSPSTELPNAKEEKESTEFSSRPVMSPVLA